MEKKIKIRICVGTQCYVMGNHELNELKSSLPDELRDKVYVEGAVCLGCDTRKDKPQPPYVEIDGKLLDKADYERIEKTIRTILKNDERITTK